MSKGTLRPLFQAAMPRKEGGEEMGDFLVVEATPKPDGKNGHRYWGVVVRPDSSNNPGSSDNPWVIPLHADVDYPSSPAGMPPDGPLMVLSFRQCPALNAARDDALAGHGGLPDLAKVGLFKGTLDEWAESIGYEVEYPQTDGDYPEVK